ncbi:MAG: hypothetical protein J7K61_06025 [Thermoplasmata archaeon]|nr:hypothetical protein [Thermoplasmata archaeon]
MKASILLAIAIIIGASISIYVYISSPHTEETNYENNIPVEDDSRECEFATYVVSYKPGENTGSFTDEKKILGPPEGMGEYRGSMDVLSLGIGGEVTLGFNVTIVDGPGDDFVVFENSFYIIGTNRVFAELAYVEVSSDGIHFARFPCIYEMNESISSYQGIDPSKVKNFAGVHPVMANTSNGISPCSIQAGGDRFDLSDLKNDSMVRQGLVKLDDIHYVRIIDIPGDGTCFDSYNHPIYDAVGGNGADIDAVAVINYK